MKRLLTCAVVASLIATNAALAQNTVVRDLRPTLIESYIAFISDDDLYNSSGQRLTRPWQIIRQDRANFHAFGIRDRGDDSDSFFSDPVNRQALENMVARGSISRSAANRIARGGVIIEVSIYGRGDVGQWIEVDVH